MRILLILWLCTANCFAQMSVQYLPAKSELAQQFHQIFQKEKTFEQLAGAINEIFKLPRPLPVYLGETGRVNAWYSPRDHSVTVSYELVVQLTKDFYPVVNNSWEEAGKMAMLTTGFIFFHEVGHALVGELDLPVVGREEDVADEFSTMIMASDPGAVPIALAGAFWFDLMSKNQDPSKLPFWDEHSLNQQRAYEILTLLYGSNPQQYKEIEQRVPAERLRRAQFDYEKKKRAWVRLLQPYAKVPLE